MPEDKPTQAAALKYDITDDDAPRVVASGRGRVAEKIVDTAFEANVPIVEDAALVSALLALEIGDEIPAELYQAVAKILSFLYDVNKMETGIKERRERGGR
jgi:flagellar biosynthesis protein